MSQPLASSPASMLSRRYTACALGPPLMNSTLMVRSIPCDGTSRYSIGRLGLENAGAVATPPAKPTNPGMTTAAAAAAASRRYQLRDTRPTIAIAALPPKAPTRLKRTIREEPPAPAVFGQSVVADLAADPPMSIIIKTTKWQPRFDDGEQAWIATSSSTSLAAR